MADLAIIVCVSFDHRASGAELAGFKACISRCPFVDTTMEVSGTYDFIVQGHCASHAEYAEHMEVIRPQVARLVDRIEANFISSKIDQRCDDDSLAMWLPCEGGRKRVEAHLIDKILAEGDYMRVHVGSWNCLLHHTLNRLNERLPKSTFIKLNRSSLVRIGFIDRLVYDEHHWKARLRDRTHVSISKSRVQQVLRLIRGESSKLEDHSTKNSNLSDVPVELNEIKAMQAL